MTNPENFSIALCDQLRLPCLLAEQIGCVTTNQALKLYSNRWLQKMYTRKIACIGDWHPMGLIA